MKCEWQKNRSHSSVRSAAAKYSPVDVKMPRGNIFGLRHSVDTNRWHQFAFIRNLFTISNWWDFVKWQTTKAMQSDTRIDLKSVFVVDREDLMAMDFVFHWRISTFIRLPNLRSNVEHKHNVHRTHAARGDVSGPPRLSIATVLFTIRIIPIHQYTIHAHTHTHERKVLW